MNWQNKLSGILGITTILLVFLGFSDTLHNFLLVLIGLMLIAVNFWGRKLIMSADELLKHASREEKSADNNDKKEIS